MRARLALLMLLTAALAAGCGATGPRRPTIGNERPPDLPTPAEAQAREPEAAPAPNAAAPTLALLRQSERSAEGGDLAGAIAYVERAIRLNARDPELWLRLAQLQLRADRAATAEQLAHKAIALAGRRDDVERQGWLLVADAMEAQGDDEAAALIRERWRTYRG